MRLAHMSGISKIIAIGMLAAMFVLLFFSQYSDTAIMDELAHIPAGYSYLTRQDMRLNPEHPPLIKDLAALPLLLLRPNFPVNVPAWQEDLNGQWTMGSIFLYESGNDADQILHWARFPLLLLAIFFGWLFFSWVRRHYGEKVALLALFFYAFSPTFIAHSRYVTTDLAAAFGFFIGIAGFLAYLQNPSRRRLLYAGVLLGIALSLKFSTFLLLPFFMLFGALWVFLSEFDELRTLPVFIKRAQRYVAKALRLFGAIILMTSIALVVIWAVYQFHVWNYPTARQVSDTATTLRSFGIRPLAGTVTWMADKPVLRPIAQYLFGLLMVIQRASGGNTTYFLGEVSAAGWRAYFPILYLLKEQLVFHILTVIALLFGIQNLRRAREKTFAAFVEWLRDNAVLTVSFTFTAFYWFFSIRSPLNIGVRHILPTLPFVYLLVSRQIVRWIHTHERFEPQSFWGTIHLLWRRFIGATRRYAVLLALLLWGFVSVLSTFPHFLSYYNALAGETMNGYRYAVDSNYDWGQDLGRLAQFIKKESIEHIALDYFGGGSPRYYLGEAFEPWQSAKGKPKGYFAVSATFLQGAQGTPVNGFRIEPEDRYRWLEGEEPIARAGTSIFIYRLE